MKQETAYAENAITEEELIRTLRAGEAGSRASVRRQFDLINERSRYEELIESSALRGRALDTPAPGGGHNYSDAVYSAMVRAGELREEEESYLRNAALRTYHRACAVASIWDAFYMLTEEEQEILRRFYTGRETPASITAELGISESTFWRRRKRAVEKLMALLRIR